MFKPYKGHRAFEDIAAQIKDAILSKRFADGDRLPPERVLASEFQVGRVTIREAFRTLETMGFIKVKKGSCGGAFVGAADSQDMARIIMDKLQLEGTTHEEMIEARIGLEYAVIGLVIQHATEEDLTLLRKNVEASKEILGSDNAQEGIARMIDFHMLLACSSHNLPYEMFVSSIMQWASKKLISWIPSPDEQRNSYLAHRGIFEALEARDEENAKQLNMEHIKRIGLTVFKPAQAYANKYGILK